MRSLLVVVADEVVELSLLLQEVLARGFGGFFLQGQVHAFVPTVLLWITRSDTLDADPEAQPPHRELAQAKEGAVAREGHPVVAADRPRQPEILESPFKHGKCVALLGGLEGFAAQQVATGEVGHGQGIAVATIREHELALVIGAPQIVGTIRSGEAGALRLEVLAPAAAGHQAMPIQYRMHGADGRQRNAQAPAFDLLADLGSTPAGVLLAQLNNQRLDLER